MNLTNELAVARQLAYDAGRILLGFYDMPANVEWKSDHEPVTAADRAANECIVSGLIAAFPGDGLLAEETPDDAERLGHGRLWAVDPMDGTKEFIKKNGEFSVMIGLAIDGKASLGVVFQPTRNRMLYAARGQGAFIEADGAVTGPLRVSDVDDTCAMSVAISRSHRSERIDSVRSALGIEREVRSGSVGLKIGLICERQCDLYIHPSPHTKQWDTCAPEAILTEAGGRMTDLTGAPFVYNRLELNNRNGILATNGRCHDEILERVSAVFAA